MGSRTIRFIVGVSVAALICLLPRTVVAQSSIAGSVKDPSGAVLPGVSVEASSPALIEKSRTVFTNGAGQYRIVDLRPGVYTVTFVLAGFNVVVREGIVLIADFTAPIDVELKVGAIEETITVAGQTPVVDVMSPVQQQVLTRDLLEAVPTGRNIWGTGATLNGVTLSAPDVGGTAGMQQTYMAVHGSERRDNAIQIDGMSVNGIEGDGAIQNYFNQGMFEEMSYQTSALGAEVQSSGVRLNMIPKDGSNALHGSGFISQVPGDWQSNNFTSALAATGLRAPNTVERIFDQNVGLGGPVKRDRWWFFTTFRRWGVDQTVTDSFYNLDSSRRSYTPDFNHSVVDDNVIKSGAVRFTFQLAQRQKFAAYVDKIVKFRGHECGAFASEESCGVRSPKNYYTAQAKYTGTLTDRLLLEAGWSENDETYSTAEPQPSVKPTDIGRADRITTETWGAPTGPYYYRVPDRHTFTGALSYITGSHAIKAGVQLGKGGNHHERSINGTNIDLRQEYRCVQSVGGVCVSRTPASVIVYNTPQIASENIKYDLGLYLQDSWTFRSLTLNPGIRLEAFNTEVPTEDAPAGRFVPARHFDRIKNLPKWQDFAPRFGAVYDLFDNGKTALKGHIGKYMRAYSTVGFAQVYNPMVFQTDRRTWTDTNGDDIAQNTEIGPVVSPFNVTGISNRTADPGIKRPYQWEYSVGVQREIVTGMALSFNWIRREYRRLIWTDNILVSQSDYSIVNIANPLVAGEIIPIYNLDVAKRGLVQQIDKNSDQNRKWYDGFDVGFTARARGANLYGGASVGRQLTANCEVDDPNSLRYCDRRTLDIPFLSQFKLAGVVPMPLGFQMSGAWQGYPGSPAGTDRQDGEYSAANNRVPDPSLNVNYVVDRTIIPNLTVASLTVPLLRPGTKYLDRWNQIDVRLAKRVGMGHAKAQVMFDVFNLLNSNAILSSVETFGSTLDRPTAILQGRLFAIGAQVNF
jgi:Carboxypeptidase regulatory-like domain